MRVIAGTARSLPLKSPAGMDTRPTTDRIKETLFNMLQSDIPGCVFVDVFSGSGAIGIEALSRGAQKAYFIENAAPAAVCIQDNLQFTKFTDRAVLLKQDCITALHSIFEKEIDILFMDPPYQSGMERRVLEELNNCRYVTEDTVIIVETSLTSDFSYLSEYGYELTKEKKYKTNRHLFFRKIPIGGRPK